MLDHSRSFLQSHDKGLALVPLHPSIIQHQHTVATRFVSWRREQRGGQSWKRHFSVHSNLNFINIFLLLLFLFLHQQSNYVVAMGENINALRCCKYRFQVLRCENFESQNASCEFHASFSRVILSELNSTVMTAWSLMKTNIFLSQSMNPLLSIVRLSYI